MEAAKDGSQPYVDLMGRRYVSLASPDLLDSTMTPVASVYVSRVRFLSVRRL